MCVSLLSAFAVAVPTIWNHLPKIIKSSETIATFYKKNQNAFV